MFSSLNSKKTLINLNQNDSITELSNQKPRRTSTRSDTNNNHCNRRNNSKQDKKTQLVILKKNKFQIFPNRNLFLNSYCFLYLDNIYLNSYFSRHFDPTDEIRHESFFNHLQRLVLRQNPVALPITASSDSPARVDRFPNELIPEDEESLGYHSFSMSSSLISSNLSTISEASIEPGQQSARKQKSGTLRQSLSSSMRRKSFLLRVLDFNFLILL